MSICLSASVGARVGPMGCSRFATEREKMQNDSATFDPFADSCSARECFKATMASAANRCAHGYPLRIDWDGILVDDR